MLMARHFDYCPSASQGDNQSVGSSAPVVSRCFPGGYNVKLYISRGRLAWWLLAFLHSGPHCFIMIIIPEWLLNVNLWLWVCLMFLGSRFMIIANYVLLYGYLISLNMQILQIMRLGLPWEDYQQIDEFPHMIDEMSFHT